MERIEKQAIINTPREQERGLIVAFSGGEASNQFMVDNSDVASGRVWKAYEKIVKPACSTSFRVIHTSIELNSSITYSNRDPAQILNLPTVF